jgi:hypothetical protein
MATGSRCYVITDMEYNNEAMYPQTSTDFPNRTPGSLEILESNDEYQSHSHSHMERILNEVDLNAYPELQHYNFDMLEGMSTNFTAGSARLPTSRNQEQDTSAYIEASPTWPPVHTHRESYGLDQNGRFMALPTKDNSETLDHNILAPSYSQSKSFDDPYSEQASPKSALQYSLQSSSLSQETAAIPSRRWWYPVPDATIPTNDIQRQRWVLKLLPAINNTTNVCDAQGQVFQNRWYRPGIGPSSFYSAESKEILAWDILALVEALHREGPSVLVSFNQEFWTKATKTKNWTFAQRMEMIMELLAMSKARCEKLLAGVGMQIVVASPQVLIKTTKANGLQNGKRQRILEAGRAVKKARIG